MNEVLGRAMHDFAMELDPETVVGALPNEFDVYTVQQFMDFDIVQPDYHGN